jgi:hypothetical protein
MNIEKTQKHAKQLTSIYICDLCNYSSKNKTDYARHLITKKHIDTLKEHKIKNENEYKIQDENNIINIKQFICRCGITYKSKQGLWKHNQKCNNTNTTINNSNDIEQTKDVDKNTLIEMIIKEREQLEKEREEFEKEKEELQKQFEKEKEELLKQIEIEKKNVETEKHRNTIESQTNNNLNIQINAFGCENLEHITEAFKIKCLKQIYKSIPEMVAKIHFNTKYPENHNVKIPNKKLPYASVMTADNVWKTVDKKNTITSMVDKSFYLLDGTYEEHKEQLSEYKRKNYETYQEKYLKNDKQLHKQLHNDVECLVLDGTR